MEVSNHKQNLEARGHAKKCSLSSWIATAPYEASRMKLGLEGIAALDRELGFPSRAFRSIHVAGTNGKGSVATKIAAALQLAGFSTGLFTSPHLFSVCERVVVDGKPIPEEDFERLLSTVAHLTFFEACTMVAFLYFAERKVDYAVVEVGLGGRLDATNILRPDLSIITSIGLDHTEILGETLEEIAFEKGGIIKAGIPVIASDQCAYLLAPLAEERESELYTVRCAGHFEEHNRALAKKALTLLSIPENKGVMQEPLCRFEKWDADVPIIFDVAHNQAAIEALYSRLGEVFPGRETITVAACSAPRESLISSIPGKVFVTQVDHPRILPVEALNHPHRYARIEEAFTEAYREAVSDDKVIVVTGSLFMMEAAQQTVRELFSPHSTLCVSTTYERGAL